MRTRVGYLPTVILLGISQTYAANFTFSYDDPTQCDDFNVSWSGGTAPYELTIIPDPFFGRTLTFSIPSSSFSDGHGSYGVQLPIPANQTMIAIMSDANGFATGGVSDVLTVGPSIGNSKCNTSAQSVDFFFEADMALNQCRYYSFTNYTGAVQPVTITGIIPGGTTFLLNPPTGPTDYQWQADLAAGTSVIFTMQDSKGRQGGSTSVEPVGPTDDASCLTGAFPSSLAVHPSATYTTSSTPVATAATNSTKSSVSGGTIAGAVVGGILGLAVIVALAIFLLRRDRRSGSYFANSSHSYRSGRKKQPEVDLTSETVDDMPPPIVHPYPLFNPAGSVSSNGHQAVALSSMSSLIHAGTQPGSTVYSLPDPYGVQSMHSRQTSDATSAFIDHSAGLRDSMASSSQDQTMTSGARRKAAMAGTPTYQTAPRFILHTDAEEVIELPPQYSAVRGPPPAAETASSDVDAPALPPQPQPNTHSAPLSGPPPPFFDEDEFMGHSNLQQPLSPGPPSAPLTPASDHRGQGPSHST